LANIVVAGAGLRTTFAGAPRITFNAVADARPGIEMVFPASPLSADRDFEVTSLTFSDVIEFHFIDFETGLHFGHEHDVKFALIEITDSTEIDRLLNHGRFSSEPPGRRLGAIGEHNVHHYRIAFDDHGTYDVICTDLVIGRSKSSDINSIS
jgi:hypothetical protein